MGELADMAARVRGVRVALREAVEKRGTPGRWALLTEQRGMFSYSGFSEE